MEALRKNKSIVAAALFTTMIFLAIIDLTLVENELIARIGSDEETSIIAQKEEINSMSGSELFYLHGEGVKKNSGPNVENVLNAMGFEEKPAKDQTIIEQIIPSEVAHTESKIILINGDRAGSIAWVETLQVKAYFIALKEALHGVFSPQVQDLIDETQQRENKPTRNLLTFFDPALSEERIVFVRVRERLYELRIAKGMDKVIFDLVEKLTE